MSFESFEIFLLETKIKGATEPTTTPNGLAKAIFNFKT